MQTQTCTVPTLTDPVCGQPVNLASPFNSIHQGVLLCFCGETCRTGFIDRPGRFVTIQRPALDAIADDVEDLQTKGLAAAPDAPQVVTEPEVVVPATDAAHAVVPQTPASEPSAIETKPAKQVWRDSMTPDSTLGDSRFSQSAYEADRREHRSGLRNLLASNFLAWREGRHAARTSRQLLKLYRNAAASHPELDERNLFKQVVMERNRCGARVAEEILDNAERSFADWPVQRDLTLCDVVHYLSMSEFLAMHDGEHWMHVDIGRVVANSIPRDLCFTRRQS